VENDIRAEPVHGLPQGIFVPHIALKMFNPIDEIKCLEVRRLGRDIYRLTGHGGP
jgi:hypothetical protein